MPLRWSNVLVIFRREVRDQLRDRRTLFMIFVLPMLLYPMLGMGMLKFTDAFNEKERTVVVVGAEHLPLRPPLLNPRNNGFSPALFDNPDESRRLIVEVVEAKGDWLDPKFRERATRVGGVEAVVTLPADLQSQIEAKKTPAVGVDYDSADESSQITYLRLKEVLARWKETLVADRLRQDRLPAAYTEPIALKPVDVATPAELGSSVWARMFPFLLVMMSLTGAFYPAVDLCAGEKERGTMETLLISPASRAEIVLGKFFTVLLASIMTALLNLASMALTGLQLAGSVAARAASASPNSPASRRALAMLSPPSLEMAFWIVLLLIPLAVFFSALCLALAVLARSMKEGQYYMTPLYLVCLPLIMLTLVPGIELNLFYSLVPITGVALLLKALIQADYATAWRFFVPVLLPTVLYGAVALRWAVDQFQREDVLFREAERFDLMAWLRHLVRDRTPTPSGAQAVLCFAVMLTAAWFYMVRQVASPSAGSGAAAMALGHLAFILLPPVLMAVVLTSSPRRTLRLYWPEPRYLALAAGLAVALNPLVNELAPVVQYYFPVSDALKAAIGQIMGGISLPTALLVFAVVPAITEEVAFRGFILSGLESAYPTRTAILMSALLFGFMHVLISLFQQLFNATLLGLVLGLLAVRSRSLLPGVLFHLITNGLGVAAGFWATNPSAARLASWIYRRPESAQYHGVLVAAGAVASVALLALLARPRPDGAAVPPPAAGRDQPTPGPLAGPA